MNSVKLLGTMTKDCELAYGQSGTARGNFGVAWNEKVKDQNGQYNDKAHFFDVTAWGKNAENINKYFHKGSRILIEGQLDFSQWEKDGQKRSKVGIKVIKFHFIDRKSDTQSAQPAQNNYSQPAPQTTNAPVPEIEINDTEIPF